MLTGTLDDFTLPDVLRLIGSARRTGRLDVTRDAGSGRLLFHDGAVRGAGAEDLTFDLMRWTHGEFSWEPEVTAPGSGVDDGEAISVDALLEHVGRRLEELAEIETLVPSEEAVFVMAPQPPEGAVQINITPGEWRVLVLVDGHRPVREIALAAGIDDVATMKVLYGLATAGLVRPAGVVPVAEPAEPGDDPCASGEVSDMTDMTDMSAVSDGLPEEGVRVALEPEPEPAPLVAPEVDRSTAARELAGLFADAEEVAGGTFVASLPAPPRPRRIEDDDQVTRGLISRMIDGVKGL
ncbi:MAG: DUF4388 domain-containing protein [Actinomycetota bacterium]|nr:DUF4388 domain-containing protein [Actinomycetota bacterium]